MPRPPSPVSSLLRPDAWRSPTAVRRDLGRRARPGGVPAGRQRLLAILIAILSGGLVPGPARGESTAAVAVEPSPSPPWVEGSETLVVLPDTEGYAGRRPDVLDAMLRWVADERERRAIRGLLHVGDVTNDNSPAEWASVRRAFNRIEGKLPYVLAVGNHDYEGQAARQTRMNEVFRARELEQRPSFGGVYEQGKLENHFQLLEIHGRPWLVLSLEMGPRKAVIAWADKVLAAHPDRMAIVLTHAYLFRDNERFDHRRGPQRATPHEFQGEGADGETLWTSLIARHPNVMLVICGHVASAAVGYRADRGIHGNLVHQMMVDYEALDGGQGFLRLLEFLPDRRTVQVRTYSPVTGGTNPVDPDLEEFRFQLEPAPTAVAGPRSIFDGASLAGWKGDPDWWRVEDGAITGEIPAGVKLKSNQFLWWEGSLADFDLGLEYRITGGDSANSGIQFRSERLPDGHAKGYQADLDDGRTWLGRIYDEHGRGLLVERGVRLAIAPDGRTWTDPFAAADAIRSVVKPGDWNRYRIRATASHVTVWINDELAAVLDDRDAKHAEFAGRLAVQLHSGAGPVKVQFRDIQLTQLGSTPPAAGPGGSPIRPDAGPIAATGVDGRPLDLGFESGTLAGWTATGDAFAGLPAPTDAVTKRKRRDASNAVGGHWVGTYEPRQSDETKGTLTSQPFPINHRWASFLVGGGGHAETRVELLDAETGEVFHQARGRAVERMHREVVDLEQRKGRRMQIRLVDERLGDWGHINYDDFVFHAARPQFADGPGQGAGREWSSPVLWHAIPNQPAAATTPAAAGSDQARATVAGMMVTPGFRCDLVASEPAIHQPIAFAIDPRGRLWVAEAHSYPNKRKEGEGRDRIVILADADGDGGFEQRTVFREGLNLVSGLEVGFGGVWVGAAPHLLFIPDRDGDDVPDGEPEVLLDGWGFQDTHETLNSFTWGPDGWLYGNHGVFTTSEVGPPGSVPADRVRINAAVWRYHPVRRAFEVFAHGGSNQWGIDFNSVGDAFMTHCRSFFGGGGTSHVIRNGHFWNQVNNGHAAFICREPPAFAPGLKNYLPAAARYDSGEGGAGKKGSDAVYGGHSHVGTMVYLGDNWPGIYRDRILTHNLHGRQMNHQEVTRRGSGYEVFPAGYDILHVPDEQYVAVDLQYAPDGAVYVIDWCDRQHCHTNVDARWDRTNGRLYRVAWADTYRPVAVDLGAKTDADLVALHAHRNEWFVRTARRLLQERAAADRLDRAALGPLRQAATSEDSVTALRALWTLHVTAGLDAALLAAAFTHPGEHVRGQAVALATELPGAPRIPTERLVAAAAAESSALVRRSLASALPALPPGDRWRLAEALAAHAADATDRFIPKLVWTGLAPLIAGDPARGLKLAATTPLPDLADSIRWYLGRLPQGRTLLAAEIATASPAVAERTLRLLDFSVAGVGTVAPPADWPSAARRFDAGEAADTVQRLSAAFGDAAVLADMRRRLADEKSPAEDRRRAFDLLARSGDPEALPLFVKLLGDPAFRGDAIPLVARSNDPAVATTLLAALPELDARKRAAAISTLVSKPAFAGPLLGAIAAGQLPQDSLSAAQVRQLRGIRDPGVAARVDAIWGKLNESPAAARATMARLKQTWAEAPHWAIDHKGHGLAVFNRVCANCHVHGDAGGKLGPNLTGSWMNGPDYFIENLVDPNAVVGPDYQLTVVITDDGRSVNGIIAEETAAALVLKTPDGPVTVPKDSIDERTTSPVSMMPSGLLENLPEADLLALLKFLTTKP